MDLPVLAEVRSVPDVVITVAIVLVAAFLAVKLAGAVAKIVVFLLLAIGVYIFVS